MGTKKKKKNPWSFTWCGWETLVQTRPQWHPQALSPLLALGQAISDLLSSCALTTCPPVLPGGPGASGFTVGCRLPCRVFAGDPHLRGGWEKEGLASDSGPAMPRPAPRGALELIHVSRFSHMGSRWQDLSTGTRQSLDLPCREAYSGVRHLSTQKELTAGATSPP